MAIPQPMDRLHDPGPPPFLTKTYDMVDDPTTDHIISWSKGNNSFVVWDSETLSMRLLPRYFKHNNFSSFIRQLNTYGFRKVDAYRWEFANEGFLRGKKHLLKNITRRKSLHQPQTTNCSSNQSLEPCVEVGILGLDKEIDQLKRDKKILIVELIKLRQQLQTSRGHLQEMEQRLQRTEMKQQQMMSFLARAMKNPEFIQQMMQQNDRRKELEEAINKKRRRPIDHQGHHITVDNKLGNYEVEVGTSFVKVEPQYYEEIISEFEGVDELETLAIGIQGVSEGRRSNEINIGDRCFVGEEFLEEEKEEDQREGRGIKEVLDDCFWGGFFSEGNEEEIGLLGTEDEGVENVDVLAEQLGYLGSSSKS